ncbi:MAG: MFS transporter [Candidatus Tectomicrobia bacterium]|nr:MFS transporter [Candidatus Tectomicrobia bacterium]
MGVCLLTLTFAFGLRYAFSVFYVALFQDFEWGRAETAGIYSVHRLVYAALAPVSGALLDRWGPRRLMPAGLAAVALAFVGASAAGSLWQVYLLLGVLLAAGLVMFEYVPNAAIVTEWFEGGRGLAAGISSSGMGTAALGLVPLSQFLISMYGWRWAFVLLGVGSFLLLTPVIVFFQRQRPQDMGYDGPKKLSGGGKVALAVVDSAWAERPWTPREAMKTRPFWFLVAAFFLQSASGEMMVVHQVAHVAGLGYSKALAASTFGLAYFFGIGGMFFWGAMSDRWGRERLYLFGTLSVLAGLGLLMSLGRTSPWPLYGFVVFYGFGFGSRPPLFLATAADIFQGRRFGAIMGAMAAGFGLGGAFGPWLGGWIYDLSGSYRGAFLVAALATSASALFVWLAAPRKVRAPRRAASTRT